MALLQGNNQEVKLIFIKASCIVVVILIGFPAMGLFLQACFAQDISITVPKSVQQQLLKELSEKLDHYSVLKQTVSTEMQKLMTMMKWAKENPTVLNDASFNRAYAKTLDRLDSNLSNLLGMKDEIQQVLGKLRVEVQDDAQQFNADVEFVRAQLAADEKEFQENEKRLDELAIAIETAKNPSEKETMLEEFWELSQYQPKLVKTINGAKQQVAEEESQPPNSDGMVSAIDEFRRTLIIQFMDWKFDRRRIRLHARFYRHQLKRKKIRAELLYGEYGIVAMAKKIDAGEESQKGIERIIQSIPKEDRFAPSPPSISKIISSPAARQLNTNEGRQELLNQVRVRARKLKRRKQTTSLRRAPR